MKINVGCRSIVIIIGKMNGSAMTGGLSLVVVESVSIWSQIPIIVDPVETSVRGMSTAGQEAVGGGRSE